LHLSFAKTAAVITMERGAAGDMSEFDLAAWFRKQLRSP
jgi:hypothetical protein